MGGDVAVTHPDMGQVPGYLENRAKWLHNEQWTDQDMGPNEPDELDEPIGTGEYLLCQADGRPSHCRGADGVNAGQQCATGAKEFVWR